jgi:DNA-binding MarR family transcriptional regulator
MFLTNHARVLLAVDKYPTIRMCDLARHVQVTERAVQSLVADLVASGCVTRVRIGRRNRYQVHYEAALDQRDAHLTVGDLVRMAPAPAPLGI